MSRASIDVKDREEAEHIRRGLARPDVRALVIMMGILETLPSDRSRVRLLRFVEEYCDEFPPPEVARR